MDLKQQTLIDKVVNLNKILPVKLLQKIKQPITFAERIELIQNFLLSGYHRKQDHYLRFVSDAIGAYAGTGLQITNCQLAEKMFSTSKTVNRYFNNVIGTSPKNYFSILRARTSLTAYVKNKKDFVPFDYGYYDMSHFYKDVVKFTGQKLTAQSL